ncbi:MAG: DUF2252 family protein [Bdellovibrio sp.]|nr:DUF2252 family protein [Bdellovibrio sp.]
MKFLMAFFIAFAGWSASPAPWRPDDGGPFSAFRSNAPHFWSWLATQSSDLFAYRGAVVGDPHILNFGDVQLAIGGRVFALIDLDDVGNRGPFVGDFIRYAAGNQVSPYNVSVKELYAAYVYGLQGNEIPVPPVVAVALARGDEEFQKRQDKYLERMTEKNRFSEKAKLEPMTVAPMDVLGVYNAVADDLAGELRGYRVLDMGYKVKESGGSQGLVRFWYLVQAGRDRQIIEFKMEDQPATEFYASQGSIQERFASVTSFFRPSAVYGPYKIVTAGGYSFLMRARLAPFLDFDPSKGLALADIHAGREVSKYIANLLGRMHGKQSAAQGLAGQLNQSARLVEVQGLVQSYVDVMAQESAR